MEKLNTSIKNGCLECVEMDDEYLQSVFLSKNEISVVSKSDISSFYSDSGNGCLECEEMNDEYLETEFHSEGALHDDISFTKETYILSNSDTSNFLSEETLGDERWLKEDLNKEV